MSNGHTNGVLNGHYTDNTDDDDDVLLQRASTHHTHSLLSAAVTHLHIHQAQHKQHWRNTLKSTGHQRYVIQRTAWSHWSALHHLEQQHSHDDTQSALHYSRELLRTAWCAWLELSRIPVAERALVVYATHHGERVKLRRTFQCFRQAIQRSRQHKQQLVKRCAGKWRKVTRRRLTQQTVLQQLCNTVHAHHQRAVIEQWQSYCRSLHSIDAHAVTLQQHHGTHLLRHALHVWRYNQLYNREHASLIVADKCYHRKCIQYAVQELKQYTAQQMRYEQLERDIGRMCNSRLLSDSMRVWQETHKQCVIDKHNMTVADHVHSVVVLQHAIIDWRNFLQKQSHKQHFLHTADQHCMQRVVRQWLSAAQTNLRRQLNERRATRHNYLTVVYTVFAAWSTPVVQQLELDEQLYTRIEPLLRAYKQQVFALWYNHMRDNYTERIQTDHAFMFYRRQRLHTAVQHMHVTAQRNKASTYKRALSVKHANKQLKRRILLRWDMQAHKQRKQHDTDQSLLHRITFLLDDSLLRSSYNVWRNLANERLTAKRQIDIADARYSRHLLQQSIHCFQNAVNVHRQHIADKYTAAQHCERQLLHSALHQWLHHLQHSRDELNKHIRALTHWSTAACRHVWRRWLTFQIEQRHQKQRQQRALEQYRRNMLVDGCVHWLNVATHIHAQQVNTVRQQHSELAARVFVAVERIAYHWYSKTFAKRDRPDRKPLLMHMPRKSAAPSLLPLSNILNTSSKSTAAAASRSVPASPSKPKLPAKQRAQPRNSLALLKHAEPVRHSTASQAADNTYAVAEQEIHHIEQRIQQYAADKQQYADDLQQYRQLITVLHNAQADVAAAFTASELQQIEQQCAVLASAIHGYEANKQATQVEIKHLLQRLHELTDVA